MRHTIDERDARRLLGGGPVTLVTTAWHGSQNVMPAAFVTPLSIDPPLIGIAVHPARHTHDMIKFSEEFALNIPTRQLLHHVQYLGSVGGGGAEQARTHPPADVPRPHASRRRCSRAASAGLSAGCTTPTSSATTRCSSAWSRPPRSRQDAFDETWLLADPEERPLHYLGVNYYAILGERLEARIPQPADIKRDVEAGAADDGRRSRGIGAHRTRSAGRGAPRARLIAQPGARVAMPQQPIMLATACHAERSEAARIRWLRRTVMSMTAGR